MTTLDPQAPFGRGPSVGIVLPSREVAITGDRPLHRLVDLAARAEGFGLDGVWVGDSPVARPRAEPFTLLGAVAAATRTITLGAAALIPTLRHPVHVAHALATVDQLAPGRLLVAVGDGFPHDGTRQEFAAFSATFAGRGRRLDAYVALWRAMWAPDPAAVALAARSLGLEVPDGALARLPGPATPGGPDVWLAAGASDRNVARIADRYDGWLPYLPSPIAYQAARHAIEARAATDDARHRPVSFALYVTLTLGPQADAVAEQDRYLRRYYGFDRATVSAVQACYAGEPDGAVGLLRDYLAAGAQHLVVRLGTFDPEPQLRLLADTVLPELRTPPVGLAHQAGTAGTAEPVR